MSEMVHIRISADNATDFNKAAKIEKMKLSAWMRRACEFEAERVLNAQKIK